MRLGSLTLSMLLSAIASQGKAPPSTFEATESVAGLNLKVDLSCILRTWRIVGVMTCPTPAGGVRTCLIVENAWPVGIFEAVRMPFASHLAEMKALSAPFAGVPRFGETSSHTADASQGTGLQFAEAHVFEWSPEIPLDFGIPLAKPRGRKFAVRYLSELDGAFWRNGLAEMLLHPEEVAKKAVLPSCSVLPRLDYCAGRWGSYFPRIGFAVDPSEVMAAHLQVLRAGRVASRPDGRIVLGAYPYEPRTGHYLQRVRPTPRACTSIGWPVRRDIEARALSLEGAYLWIHFGIFRECRGCLPPTLAEPRVPAP